MRKSSRETKKTEVFSFPEASSSIVADSDDEVFGMDSSQSITKRANKMTKEPTLFDKYKSGGNKAVEIIGKELDLLSALPFSKLHASSIAQMLFRRTAI